MVSPKALTDAVTALKRLPGVGERSASRMVFHLLQHDPQAALQIAKALEKAVAQLSHCELCHTFTDTPVCTCCADKARDQTRLCVVETPADQMAMERSGAFKGLYYVLMGRLSPLDGVGPGDIGLQGLLRRVDETATEEIILATGFSAEGEVTAHYITQALKHRGLKITRLARGIPAGSDLEYVDLSTLAQALADRR